MSFTPTDEQQAIIEAARGPHSLMIQAFAGCSKTTSLVMLAAALPAVPTLALAFNKKIADELKTRFPSHIDVKTLNGLGHSAWGRAIGKRLTLDDKKLGNLVNEVFREAKWPGDGKRPPAEDWEYVMKLVSDAQQAGLVPERFAPKGLVPDEPDTWRELAEARWGYFNQHLAGFAYEVLCRSITQAIQGVINFDDQIYMSALFGGVFQKYSIVMVDEAQDLSPLNHLQLSKVSPPAGRLIVVGDKKQAIYAFRGASTSSMAKIRKLKSQEAWHDLTLSMTFRCPKVVVDRQQDHVPGFRAAPANYEGFFHVFKRPGDIPLDEPFWDWQDIKTLAEAHKCSSFAVLCRNNPPLFSTAFRLIRAGVGCQMLGRDIGKSLGALAKKIIPQEGTPAPDCVKLISEWIDNETAKARANGNDDKADQVHDRGYCLMAVLDSAPHVHTREDLLTALEALFARKDQLVTLATGHRAKGLEWDLVVHLDPWRVPRKGAEGAALEQELNLKYVIETRARRVFVHANAEDLKI